MVIPMGVSFGPYTIHEQLGAGGMATVHRAEIVVDGEVQSVALKCLAPDLANNIQFVRRFVDEARLGQKLRHANIAKTFDVGRIEGTHYIALEYVRGPTVQALLLRSMQTGQPVPVFISLHVVTQVARALAYAHGLREESGRPLNLIHRDIAPSNIMVSDTGATKLIDFGVAKTATGHVRTAVGSIIGKLGYVAPEYLRGSLDPRVDIYSLGVVAYELLTARKLFEVDDVRTAHHLRSCEIEPPSRINPCVPALLDDIVLQALSLDPAQRWQSAFELYTSLSDFTHATGLEVHDRDVGAWVQHEIEQQPQEPEALPSMRTSEIEIDIDAAFARVRMQTRPGTQNEWLNEWVKGTATR